MKHHNSYCRKVAKYTKLLSLILLLTVTNSSNAQSDTIQSTHNDLNNQHRGDSIYMIVDKLPEFPGGVKELMKQLYDNIQYPTEAIAKGVEGRVIANFIVEKEGNISNVNIIKGVDSLLDTEAARVILDMPKWIPGELKGEVVRVRYTLPVSFKLEPGDTVENTNEDEIYTEVDQQPEFPEGVSALMRFLTENVNYSTESVRKRVQGRVVTNFIIEKDGSISNIVVNEGVNKELDAEAIRVISMMPKWKPGKNNGEIVRVNFTLPLTFRVGNSSRR